jgi:hypothetical protein
MGTIVSPVFDGGKNIFLHIKYVKKKHKYVEQTS